MHKQNTPCITDVKPQMHCEPCSNFEQNIPMMHNMEMSYMCPHDCIPQELVIENVKLAHAYVPFQKYCKIFSPMESLCKGTVFPELYDPYKIGCGCK